MRRLLEEDATTFERLLLESADLDVPPEDASPRLLDRLDDAPVAAVDFVRARTRKATAWIALLAACLGAAVLVYDRTRHRTEPISQDVPIVTAPTNIASPIGPPPPAPVPEPPPAAPARAPSSPPAALSSPRRAVTADAGVTPNAEDPPFDRGAAAAALKVIDLHDCKSYDGPDGNGHVMVVFEGTGFTTEVRVDPPFAGTPRGECITGKYRAARVPRFSGPAVRVGKFFVIN